MDKKTFIFEALVEFAHHGSRNPEEGLVYIRGSDIADAQRRCKRLPGIKKNRSLRLPNIKELSESEITALRENATGRFYAFLTKLERKVYYYRP
tara:strand:- start:10 stop:291 length:282 start_codon:yes stop_codon:yes gene_type:complete